MSEFEVMDRTSDPKYQNPTHCPTIPLEMAASFLSPHPNVSIPLDILSQPQDERIKLAVVAIRESGTKPNGDPNYSARQAARDFGVPRSSLGICLQGMYYFSR
jgi:hypothetical protein